MRQLQLILLLVLAAGVVVEWMGWPGEYRQALKIEPPAEASEGESQLIPVQPQALHEQQYYAEVVQRTLFREDRQGYQGEVVNAVSTVAPKVPQIRLMGVILTTSEKPMAVILDEKQKKSLNLQVGDLLGEWEIKEISPGSITLGWQDQTERVELRKY